jgi:hypothetical protein
MVGQAVGIALCVLLWGARVYVKAKYRVRYRVAGKVRWVWKQGTPDWITRAAPWLEFLSWAAFLGFLAWLAFRPVAVRGA